MPKYRAKVVDVEAIQWPLLEKDYPEWLQAAFAVPQGDIGSVYDCMGPADGTLVVTMPDGTPEICGRGDYLVRDGRGEITPWKEHIFRDTYAEIPTA